MITLEVNQLRLADYTFCAAGSNQCGERWDCEHDANHAYAQLGAGDTYALVHVRTYRQPELTSLSGKHQAIPPIVFRLHQLQLG